MLISFKDSPANSLTREENSTLMDFFESLHCRKRGISWSSTTSMKRQKKYLFKYLLNEIRSCINYYNLPLYNGEVKENHNTCD